MRKFEEEAQPLLQGLIMHASGDGLDLDGTTELYALIEFLQKKLKNRRETIREAILEYVKQYGKDTDNGGHRLVTKDQHEISREVRVAKDPDPDALIELLKAKGIDTSKAFDEVTVLELNPSKLDYLLKVGALEKEDVDKLRKKSEALKVKPSSDMKKRLEELVSLRSNGLGGDREVLTEKAPQRARKRSSRK